MIRRRCGLRKLQLDVSQLLGQFFTRACQRTLGGESIDQTEQFVVVMDRRLIERIDEGAPVHFIGNPSLALEHDERFTYWYPTHAKVLGNRILRDPHARAQHALEDQASDMRRDVFPTRRADELFLATSVRAAPGRSGGTRSRRWHTYILCESAHQEADLNFLAPSMPQLSATWPHGPGFRGNEMNNIYNLSNGVCGRCVRARGGWGSRPVAMSERGRVTVSSRRGCQ